MRAYLFKLRVPSLVVALGLQVSPMVRAVLPHLQTASNLMAIVFKWGAAAAATLGSIQAVSGASTTITSASSAEATEGEPFNMRLTTGPETAGYWEASGMPNGISLLKLSSTRWYLDGTPTEHGTFRVNLLAKENATTTNPERRVTGTLTLTVIGTVVEVAPTITSGPANTTITEGDNASFSITADGTAPIAYQWRFNGATIAGANSATLTLSSVTTQQAGQYDVVVSNNAGSTTSTPATLTVNSLPPPVVETITVQAGKIEMSFTPQAGKTYVLESTGDGGQSWSSAQTIDTSAGTGPVKVQIPIGTARYEFFRLRIK